MVKTLSITAPSHWTSAILNMDYSGLNEEDKKQLNTFLANNSLSFTDCLDCKDAGFLRHHDAFNECPYAADCQEYIFPVHSCA